MTIGVARPTPLDEALADAMDGTGTPDRVEDRVRQVFTGLGLEAALPAGPASVRAPVAVSPELVHGPAVAPGATPVDRPIEVRLVQYALRPAALVHCPAPEAARLRDSLRARGLAAVMSPWEFVPDRDARANHYVNRMAGVRLSQNDPHAWRGLVVSPDWRRVAAAWLCLYHGWDEALGRLLGYPSCCSATFAARWQVAAREHHGEVGDVIIREHPTEGLIRLGHPAANIFARHFGDHLLEHFPCRFDCAETARLGRRTLAGLRRYEPEHAARLERALARPIYRTRGGETFQLFSARVEAGGAVTFRHVRASDPNSATAGALARTTTLPAVRNGWLLCSSAGVAEAS